MERLVEPMALVYIVDDEPHIRRLAAIAAERDCGRLEWWCLDWNTPSIGFYKSLGAETMEDWTVYRLTGPALQRLAEPESPVAETDEI